jgi:glutamyl-tRNA reductase
MHIVCFGLNHKTADVDVRERFAFADRELPAALQQLKAIEGVREALILSTCNRVEHYAVLEPGPDPEQRARSLFWKYCAAQGWAEPADGQFYHHDAPRSVEHLFRVACGLDSMILGETEILGQVKRAYLLALGAGSTSRVLNKLFQRALQVAKQVRSKTQIGRGAVSVGSAAVDLAEKLFGDLAGCQVLVLGAGEMGERTARHLLARGVPGERLTVANRSAERAAALAESLGGRAAPLEEWPQVAAQADILISSTSAEGIVVKKSRLQKIMAARRDRPLFVIDIAVPRDVEPEANEIEGVYLYDIDSLQDIAQQAMESRQREMATCERIIGGHVREFEEWSARESARLGLTPAPQESPAWVAAEPSAAE